MTVLFKYSLVYLKDQKNIMYLHMKADFVNFKCFLLVIIIFVKVFEFLFIYYHFDTLKICKF